MSKSGPLPAAVMDSRFLIRLIVVAVAATGLVAIVSAFFSPRWAMHFALVGFWMAGNALILGTLLWAATSTPKRPFTVFIAAPLKVLWLGVLGLYCWRLEPPGTAVVTGLTVFFASVVGSVLHWMQTQQNEPTFERSE